MSVFNEFHYPTMPREIAKMLEPLKRKKGESVLSSAFSNSYKVRSLRYRSILEPQAGQGNICDYLVEECNEEKKNISCIEIDEELRATLTGKGYKVIDSDFLTFNDPNYFDLVIMNPPWRYGADHALKGWEVVADGGDVVALLNAETIRNQSNEKRKLLWRLIEEHGKVEFIGQAFMDAERKTTAEAAIIWLHKPERNKTTDFGGDYDQDGFIDDVIHAENPLASANILESLVAQYHGAKSAMIEIHKANAKYRFYTSSVIKRNSDVEVSADQSLNDQIAELKRHFWQYIFDKTSIGDRTTSSVKKEFNKFQAEMSSMSFNMHNILHLREMLIMNVGSIMSNCLIEVFDQATRLHEKNRLHVEGWKTNKSYRINQKIIVPWGITHDNGYWTANYYKCDFYRDLDKAMCFLSGKKYEQIDDIYNVMNRRMDELNKMRYAKYGDEWKSYDDMIESTFFKIRFYKKGTIHLIFKDQDLLDRFNIAVAEGKNWIGGGY